MKNDINASIATEEQEIPTFKTLREELGCKNCTKNCKFADSYYNSSPNSKWGCEKEKRKIKTIETIVFAAIEVISILIFYFLLKNIFITIFLGIALVGVMIWFDFEKIDNLLSDRYKKIEDGRKTAFDKNVEAIKATNESIRRKANGETDEYIAFKNKAIQLTQKFFEQKEKICSTLTNDDEKENMFKKLFSNLYNNLNELTDKISPTTYEYEFIQKFYNSHIPTLIESIDKYYSKSEHSLREKVSFEKLIETFDKKIENVHTALNEETENDFVSKMEDLQNQMLSNK